MSRYIDADELYVDWYDSFVADDGTEYENIPLITKGQIDDAPSIDIIHCGECKYRRMYDDGETKYHYCALEDRPNRQWSVKETDYCSWGEREGE